MKHRSKMVCLATLANTLSIAAAAAGPPQHKGAETAAIDALILAYQNALNAADARAAIRLYDDDAVLMPAGSASMVGKPAISKAYLAGAKSLSFHVKFSILEAEKIGADWAFARTTSAGTMRLNSSGVTSPEANQELFLLRKQEDGSWKIARYSFSSTGPAPGR